jgi:poly(hydroxyalkanoate) depolymerase family esterase
MKKILGFFKVGFVLGILVTILGGCGVQPVSGSDAQSATQSVSKSDVSAEGNQDLWKMGEWQEKAMGGFEQVHFYVPSSQSPIGKGRALLLVLHGCLQMPSAFLTANMENPAESYGAVIALPNAIFKQGMKCWVFWRRPEREGNNDYAHIFNVVNTLLADKTLNIDPDQVYISGLSSGGIYAMQMGCLAPDVFAGMGVFAAPSGGTPAHLTLQATRAGSAEGAAEKCLEYAGDNKTFFNTQIMSAATGDSDPISHPAYAPQNANAMAMVYGVRALPGVNRIEGGRGANEKVWENGRVSLLEIEAMGHNWSAGEGGRGSYVSPNGPNYTEYLLKFFSENNARVKE